MGVGNNFPYSSVMEGGEGEMKKRHKLFASFFSIWLSATLSIAAQTGGPYDLSHNVIASGGGRAMPDNEIEACSRLFMEKLSEFGPKPNVSFGLCVL